jgi:predicted flap endonuclease-1-like 5' DNA nuclease
MTNTDQGMFSCRNICWIVGALLGLVLLLLVGGLLGLIVAIALAVAVGLVLQRMFCTVGSAESGAAAGVGTGAPAAKPADPSVAAEQDVVDRAMAEAKTARDAEEAEKAAEAAEAARKAAEEKAAAEVDLARKAAAEEAAAAARAAQKVAEDKAAPAENAGEGTRPEGLDAPRGGGADDLKLIKGVGPKLEGLLHDLGYYHYDQIANWTKAEVAWVDKNLKGFKGRVSRDGWVAQARALASGEETEFSKRASETGKYNE